MSRRFQFSLFVWMLVGTFGCSPQTVPPATKPASDKGETSETIVHVYRLDGFYYDKLAKTTDGPFDPPANSLRKWPILEQKRIHDRRLATEFSAAVDTSSNFGGSGKDCFWPGMAITLGEGEEQVDAIICLQCDLIDLYRPGEVVVQKPLSDRGHREFARLFVAAFPEQPKP